MDAQTTNAQHRGRDRARDAPVSRLRHHGTDEAGRTSDGHALHRTALGRLGHGGGSGGARHRAREGTGAARPRRATSWLGNARDTAKDGTLHTSRSRAGRTEHPAALAVEPHRFAHRISSLAHA